MSSYLHHTLEVQGPKLSVLYQSKGRRAEFETNVFI